MTIFQDSTIVAPLQPGNKPDFMQPRIDDSARCPTAGNDNYSCLEQFIFERAVMRELSGDVDF